MSYLSNLDQNGTSVNQQEFSSNDNLNHQSVTSLEKNDNTDSSRQKKREIYRLKTDWLISSLAWSNEPDNTFTLALSSYIEDYNNKISVARLAKDDMNEEIKVIGTFDHPYPATKILWVPRPPTNTNTRLPKLLATTADYLRLWRLRDELQTKNQTNESDDDGGNLVDDTLSDQSKQEIRLECLLNPNNGSKNCAPLTSFDWNDIDPSIIITSSVDTTCAVWDIEACQVVDSAQLHNDKIIHNLRNQIVAHNHEVYDVAFTRSGSGRDVFVSVGGDGSCRLFDLRRLSTSSMLYETDPRTTLSDNIALVRVSCNKQDSNYVSAFGTNSKDVILIDIRQPGRPVAMLSCHAEEVNSMSWAPHSAHHICTASDDHQALIWDLSKLPTPVNEPLLAYRAEGKINVITWSASQSDWIAIGYDNCMELLRV